MYTVYILYSANFKKTYVGYTRDLNARFASHNSLATKGYTLRFRPWVLIYTEVFETKKDALLREKQLKSGKGRDFIKTLLLEKILR